MSLANCKPEKSNKAYIVHWHLDRKVRFVCFVLLFLKALKQQTANGLNMPGKLTPHPDWSLSYFWVVLFNFFIPLEEYDLVNRVQRF